MKKLTLLVVLGLILLLTGCIGESSIIEKEIRVLEIRESYNDDYKYRVRLSASQGWSYLYTDTYYKVGEKVQIIQKDSVH